MMTHVHDHLALVQDALQWAGHQLAETSEPILAARMLLAHVLGATLTDLAVHPERTLAPGARSHYTHLVARRAQHEPVAYLVGRRGFLDFELAVTPDVLIPRPETELLVEHALRALSRWTRPRVVDVGTGSGAIAIAVARVTDATVYAVERSAPALAVARANAQRCGVADRITFLHGDLLAPLPVPADVVIANLPYVAESEYAALPLEIRLYEPPSALVAGADGLQAIRALLSMAPGSIAEGALILLEIGATQGAAVIALARRAFPAADSTLSADYAGHDRIVHIQLAAPRRLPPPS